MYIYIERETEREREREIHTHTHTHTHTQCMYTERGSFGRPGTRLSRIIFTHTQHIHMYSYVHSYVPTHNIDSSLGNTHTHIHTHTYTYTHNIGTGNTHTHTHV
jgi:hypothetical protein